MHVHREGVDFEKKKVKDGKTGMDLFSIINLPNLIMLLQPPHLW